MSQKVEMPLVKYEMPDEPFVEQTPYQQADRLSYFRLANEGVGKETPPEGPTQDDILDTVRRAKDDNYEVRRAAVEQLAFSYDIPAEQRAEYLKMFTNLQAIENKDANQYEQAEMLLERSHDQSLALREGTLEEDGARIEERTGSRRQAAIASTNVKTKKEAILVSAAMSTDDDEEANKLLNTAYRNADNQYFFRPRMIGKGGATDLLNTGLELVPGSFNLGVNVIVLDLLQTSGIKSLQDFGNKYRGIDMKKFAEEGSGELKAKAAGLVAGLSPEDKRKFAAHLEAYRKAPIGTNASGGRTLALQDAYGALLQDVLTRDPNSEQGFLDKWIGAAVNFVGQETVMDAAQGLDSFATLVDFGGPMVLLTRGARNTNRMLKAAVHRAPISRNVVAREVATAVRAGGKGVEEDLPGAIATGLPKSRVAFDRSNISADLNKAFEEIDALSGRVEEQLMSIIKRPIALVADGAPVAVREFVRSRGLHGSPANSVIEISEDQTNISVTGRFGGGDNVGYKTKEDAQAAIARMGLSEYAGEVKYSLRDKNSGVIYTEADGDIFKAAQSLSVSKRGAKHFEWFVDTSYNIPVNRLIYSDGIGENLIEGMGVPLLRRALFASSPTSSNSMFIKAFSSFSPGNMFRNIYSALSPKVVNGMRLAAGSERDAEALFKTLYNNAVKRIPDAEWPAVNKAMRATQANKGTLTKQALRSLGVESDGAIAGYYAMQRGLEVSYAFARTGLSRSLAAQGYVRITSPKGRFLGYAKEVDTIPELKQGEAVKYVDDGGETIIRTMGPAEMAGLKERGYTLYKSQEIEWSGGMEVPYVAVKAADPKMKVIPVKEGDDVLNAVPGYFPENLNDNYVVFGRSKSGRKYIVATARSEQAVKDFVAKEFPNQTFKQGSEFAEKYTELVAEPFGSVWNQSLQIRQGLYENLNGLVYGKKGEAIVSLDGPVGSNYTDPMEAVYTTFRLLADNYTKGAHVQYLENTLMASLRKYPELLNNSQDVMLRGYVSIDDVVSSPPQYLQKQWEELTSTLNTIEAYKLLPDDTVAATSKVSAWAASKATNWSGVQEIMQRASRTGFSPMNFWKKFRYNTIIRMRPAPHYMLNSMQAVMNLGWPVSSGKAIVSHGTFQTALYARLDYAGGQISKQEMMKRIRELDKFKSVTGLSSDELYDLADSYVTSGLWEQVKHNSTMKFATLSDAEQLGRPRNSGVSRLSQVANSIGDSFDAIGAPAGEHYATQFTYLAQYFATRGKNKSYLKSPTNKAALLGRTQDFLGNMTPEGQLGIQRGFLSASTQFQAFGMKMQFTLTPFLQPTTLSKIDALRLGVGAVPILGVRAFETSALLYKTWLDSYINDPDHLERREQWERSPIRPIAEKGIINSAIDALVRNVAFLFDKDVSFMDVNAIEWDLASKMGTGASTGIWYTVLENARGYVEAFSDFSDGSLFSKEGFSNKIDGGKKLLSTLLGLDNSVVTVAERYFSLYGGMGTENLTPEEYAKLIAIAGWDVVKKMVPVFGDAERYMILRDTGQLMTGGVPSGESGKGSLADFFYIVGANAPTESEADWYRYVNSWKTMKSSEENYRKQVQDTASNLRKYIYSDVLIEGLPGEIQHQAVEKYRAGLTIFFAAMEDKQFVLDVQDDLERQLRDDIIRDTKEGKKVKAWVGEISNPSLNKEAYERLEEIRKSGLGMESSELLDSLIKAYKEQTYVRGEK